MRKIKFFILLIIISVLSSQNVVNSVDSGLDTALNVQIQTDIVTLIGRENTCMVNDTKVNLVEKAYLYNNEPYLPLDDILPALGYTLGWDDSLSALVCTRDGVVSYMFPSRNNIWVGPVEYVFDEMPLIISNRAYASKKMFETLTGAKVETEGNLEEYKYIKLLGSESKCLINDKEYPLYDKAYSRDGKFYIPVDDVLPALDYTLGWDSNLSAVICTKDGIVSYLFPSRNNMWIGPVEHIFDHYPLIIDSRAYISHDMFATLTGCRVFAEGEITEYKDRLSILKSVKNNSNRLSGSSVYVGGGVYVIDGFGMELVTIPYNAALSYAGVINSLASSLDPSINVYNIIVPTSAEHYAPDKYYPNQLAGIQNIYKNLSDRVTPINIYDILSNNKHEKIYFKTDHHWTQRGAYYAYKEFMAHRGVTVPDINTFENVPSYNFLGSFPGFAGKTTAGNILRSSPELLERFVPKYATTGTIYSDQNLKFKSGTIKAVNTTFNSYSCFIGGDNPITIFDTGVNNGKTIVIIKESFGNAFSTWALNDFSRVCVIDPRKFNGFQGYNTPFNLNQFCKNVGATDVMFINYPAAVASAPIRNAISKMK